MKGTIPKNGLIEILNGHLDIIDPLRINGYYCFYDENRKMVCLKEKEFHDIYLITSDDILYTNINHPEINTVREALDKLFKRVKGVE